MHVLKKSNRPWQTHPSPDVNFTQPLDGSRWQDFKKVICPIQLNNMHKRMINNSVFKNQDFESNAKVVTREDLVFPSQANKNKIKISKKSNNSIQRVKRMINGTAGLYWPQQSIQMACSYHRSE